VGAAALAVEETIKLPKTILMYPMTLVSQAAYIVMRCQQSMAELVVKGDATLETLFPPNDEQPEWATFDEDLLDEQASGPQPADGERRAEGRFALYSPSEAGDADPASIPTPARPAAKPAATATVSAPAVAGELDYETLTLAQLRARLNTLNLDDLQALLAYEEATKARAPFQTLLASAIARTTAK
jgi:hypothetical protein